MSTGSRPELPQADLSRVNQRNREKYTLERKWFKIQRQGSLHVQTINVDVKDVYDVFNKICKMLKLEDKMDKVLLQYPQRNETVGLPDAITIAKDDFIEESLMTFYLTCEEGSKIIVVLDEENKARDYRTVEYGYNAIVKKTFTVDLRFYQYLEENPDIAEKYLASRKYINLILGSNCMNYLNPAVYLCHIKGCEELVKLGSFNNVSKITSHIKKHSADNNVCCKAIIKRHNSLTKIEETSLETSSKKKKKRKAWIPVIDFESAMAKLNAEVGEADTNNKNFIEQGTKTKFKGQYWMVDLDILEKIVKRDQEALSSVAIAEVMPDRNRIDSYYTKAIHNNIRSRSRADINNNKSTNSTTKSTNSTTNKSTNSTTNKSTNSTSNKSTIPTTNKSTNSTTNKSTNSTTKSTNSTNKSATNKSATNASAANKSATNKSAAVGSNKHAANNTNAVDFDKNININIQCTTAATHKSIHDNGVSNKIVVSRSPAAVLRPKSPAVGKKHAAREASSEVSASTYNDQEALIEKRLASQAIVAVDDRVDQKILQYQERHQMDMHAETAPVSTEQNHSSSSSSSSSESDDSDSSSGDESDDEGIKPSGGKRIKVDSTSESSDDED